MLTFDQFSLLQHVVSAANFYGPSVLKDSTGQLGVRNTWAELERAMTAACLGGIDREQVYGLARVAARRSARVDHEWMTQPSVRARMPYVPVPSLERARQIIDETLR
jgi:hypothetical protein